MHQVATPIWNAIAKTQRLNSRPWGQWMALDGQSLVEALDKQGKELESSGASARVILAYQTVGPLLAENVAISRYIQQKGNASLRNSLPELTTTNEAIYLASQEYELTQADQTRLGKLLDQ